MYVCYLIPNLNHTIGTARCGLNPPTSVCDAPSVIANSGCNFHVKTELLLGNLLVKKDGKIFQTFNMGQHGSSI